MGKWQIHSPPSPVSSCISNAILGSIAASLQSITTVTYHENPCINNNSNKWISQWLQSEYIQIQHASKKQLLLFSNNAGFCTFAGQVTSISTNAWIMTILLVLGKLPSLSDWGMFSFTHITARKHEWKHSTSFWVVPVGESVLPFVLLMKFPHAKMKTTVLPCETRMFYHPFLILAWQKYLSLNKIVSCISHCWKWETD